MLRRGRAGEDEKTRARRVRVGRVAFNGMVFGRLSHPKRPTRKEGGRRGWKKGTSFWIVPPGCAP
jgi:hypothetical protein